MRDLEVQEHENFQNIYWLRFEGQCRLATRNLAPTVSVYGEELFSHESIEYRVWNPYRSKLAAAIYKGVTEVPIKPGTAVLYLGAASGTTVSHVSDVVGKDGEVYAIDFSQRTMRDLIERVCRHRANVQPILADARIPSQYRLMVGNVDVIYCDVAQPEQAKLLASNSDMFLRRRGTVMIAVKSRSIDVTLRPEEVFEREIETLRRRGFRILESIRLEPYDRDHAMITAKFEK
jgi:fibrillarin-like pre-rRNA processing protein